MEDELRTVDSTEEVTEEKEGKFYTPEEIALIEQKAGDKRITQYQKTLEKKQKEADRLRNMSDQERYVYELEQREKVIEEKERQLTLAENKSVASQILVEKGLDISLVDLVLADDATDMNNNIKLLEKAFKKSVKAEVENRLKSKTPVQTVDTNKSYSTKDFSKMSMKEMAELYKEAPEQFTK